MFKVIKSNNSKILILKINKFGLFIKRRKNLNDLIKIDGYRNNKILFRWKNYEIYKYDDFLYRKTLHDYLYSNDYICDLNFIIDQYKDNLSKCIVKNEKETKNISFFKNRVNELKTTIEDKRLNYTFYYNNKKYNIKKIIKETRLKLLENKNVLSFITQGDPTDTNIAINGTFTDFDNYGYNSMIGEIAIAFASFFSHGNYFYPKYHSSVYSIRKKILNEYSNYKQNLEYKVVENKIYLSCKFRIPKKNKQFLLEYLKIFEPYKYDCSFEYIKYYICMRMLTPIKLEKMDLEDLLISISYIIFIYENIYDYNSLVSLLKNMELMEEKNGKAIN